MVVKAERKVFLLKEDAARSDTPAEQFADENEMYSCFMSAKTGDNVAQCFHRVAADLAGVVLTKPELEAR